VRRKAIKLLNERKADDHIKSLIPLLDFQFNEEDETFSEFELLECLLDVFVKRDIREALPAVIELQPRYETYLRHEENAMSLIDRDLFPSTRAGLGDESMLVKTIQNSFNDWHRCRKRAKKALKKLVRHLGEEKVLALLGDDYRSEKLSDLYLELAGKAKWTLVQRWALDGYLDSNEDEEGTTYLLPFLDADWYVAKRISEHLILSELSDDAVLQAELRTDNFSNNAKYWIVYCLMQRGVDISGFEEWVPELRIPLPDFIPDTMRQVIVQEWALQAQPRSDIRWAIEKGPAQSDRSKHVVKATEHYDAEARIDQLMTLLKHHGVNVSECVNYAREMQQGSSTYYVIKMKSDHCEEEDAGVDGKNSISVFEDWLCVSMLGPYIYYSRHQNSNYYNEDNEWVGGSSGARSEEGREEVQQVYRQLAQELGFEWLTPEQLDYTLPGLNIYFFGEREPLRIHDLLFYWQD